MKDTKYNHGYAIKINVALIEIIDKILQCPELQTLASKCSSLHPPDAAKMFKEKILDR